MSVWLFVTPATVARQVPPLSMGFSQQEHWNGLPFLSPGDLPSPGIKLKFLASPALAGRFFINEPPEFVPNSIVVDLLCGLRADSWILPLLHSICCNILFWLKYMRKSWLHTVGEGRYFYNFSNNFSFTSVQSLSHVWLFVTPWIATCQASLSITNSQSPPKPMSIESVMPSSHLILCRPLPSCPQSFLDQGLFKWVSSSHQVAKVLEFQLQHKSFQWTPRTDLL